MNLAKQKGFTMIELIVAIVIVAVLAATALPKFINIGSNARAARVNAMAAQLRSVSSLVYADCMIKLKNCRSIAYSTHTIWGKNLRLNHGYPGCGGNMNNNQIDILVDTTGWTVSLPSSALTKFSLTDAPTPENCSVTYRDVFHHYSRTPVITTIKTGC